ncbi:MAG: Calx-beta domain-containing protein [Geminicoccaceae bacterium]
MRLAALPMLAIVLLAADPSALHADETAAAVHPLEEVIRSSGSKPARFVLVGGRTVVGRIIRIDDDTLLIRRPSAGLLSLPMADIATVKIRSTSGELLSGRIARTADGGIGWKADGDRAATTQIAEAGSEVQAADTGGPLIRLDDTPVGDNGVIEEVADDGAKVQPAALGPDDGDAPATATPSALIPTDPEKIRLTVTAEETNESDKLMYFQLTLSEPATQSILIIYTMINGSAVAPGDYTHRQGVVVFEPGETKAVVATSIVDDDTTEGAESFAFFVTADPAAVTIDDRKIEATITDDDG